MRSNQSVISAMLGIALLAMPITAAANSKNEARRANPAPAFHPAPARAFRPAPAPRFNPPPRSFAPSAMNFRAANNFKPAPPQNFYRPVPMPPAPVRGFTQPHPMPPVPPARTFFQPRPMPPVPPARTFFQPRPMPPVSPVGWNNVPPPVNPGWNQQEHRRDYGWDRDHREFDRDDFRTVCDRDGDNCRQVPYETENRYMPPAPSYGYQQPAYAPAYRDYEDMPYACDEDGDNCRPNSQYDGSYGDMYGPNPQYDYTAMPGENLIAYRARVLAIRDNAMARYQQAVRRRDRRSAGALKAYVRDLNKRLNNLDRRIAAQSGGGAYGYAPGASLGSYAGTGAYANPYANSYSPYAGTTGASGLYSMVAPLLGNYVP